MKPFPNTSEAMSTSIAFRRDHFKKLASTAVPPKRQNDEARKPQHRLASIAGRFLEIGHAVGLTASMPVKAAASVENA
jgi:hypothetical protein